MGKELHGLAWLAFAPALLGIQFGGAAVAQTADDDASTDRIIVTAQKREQSIQDVSASVVAIDGTEIQRRNIQELSDYATAVPGVSYDASQGPTGARGRQTLGIRGLSRFSGLSQNTVGFYIDETPVDITNPRIFDLNRIEVLRGPQGTLYGAGSVGGTIKLITNQPDPSGAAFTTNLNVSSLTDGGVGTEFDQMVNLPLGDSAALRVVGVDRRQSGWVDTYDELGGLIDSDVNDEKSQELRAALMFSPASWLTITPSVYLHSLEYGADATYVVGAGLPERARNEFVPTRSDEDFTLYGVNIRADLGFADLVSQTSTYDFEGTSIEDITELFSPVLGFDYPSAATAVTEQKALVHETRIVSKQPGPLQYVAGVFYEDSERPFSYVLRAGLPVLGPYGDLYSDVHSTRDQTQYAVFGELTYSLNPDLDVTAGLRYFNFESDSTDDFGGFQFAGVPALEPGSAEEDGVNPKLAVTYRVNDDAMVYASASRGFRPGGSNIPLPDTCDASLTAAGVTPPGPSSFESDTVWNYEAGVRTSWLSNRVTANLTAFRMDWDNLQLLVPLPSCGIQGFLVNAGEARSDGAEAELALRPTDALSLSIGAAYIDAQLTEDSVVLAAPEGSKLLFTPKLTWSASAEYHVALSGRLDAYARADLRYRDKTNLDYAGVLRSEDYVRTDLRFGVLGEADNGVGWELALYGENLADEAPVLSIDPRPYLGGDTVTSIEPRKVGVNLTVHY